VIKLLDSFEFLTQMKKFLTSVSDKVMHGSMAAFCLLAVASFFAYESAGNLFAASFIDNYFQHNAIVQSADKKTNTFEDFFQKRVVQQQIKVDTANQAFTIDRVKRTFDTNDKPTNIIEINTDHAECADIAAENEILKKKLAVYESEEESELTSVFDELPFDEEDIQAVGDPVELDLEAIESDDFDFEDFEDLEDLLSDF